MGVFYNCDSQNVDETEKKMWFLIIMQGWTLSLLLLIYRLQKLKQNVSISCELLSAWKWYI